MFAAEKVGKISVLGKDEHLSLYSALLFFFSSFFCSVRNTNNLLLLESTNNVFC